MITVALRYSENFAPDCGTIKAHEQLIVADGFVYYGKLGVPLSKRIIQQMMQNEDKRFLLIHSGRSDRYWAEYEEVIRECPPLEHIPSYYRNRVKDFSTWFKVLNFEPAPSDVMKHCVVNSNNKPLGEVSKQSMSPYFIIRTK